MHIFTFLSVLTHSLSFSLNCFHYLSLKLSVYSPLWKYLFFIDFISLFVLVILHIHTMLILSFFGIYLISFIFCFLKFCVQILSLSLISCYFMQLSHSYMPELHSWLFAFFFFSLFNAMSFLPFFHIKFLNISQLYISPLFLIKFLFQTTISVCSLCSCF